MILFTKILKITSPFRKYNFEIFLGFKMALLKYLKRVDAKKPIKIDNVLTEARWAIFICYANVIDRIG